MKESSPLQTPAAQQFQLLKIRFVGASRCKAALRTKNTSLWMQNHWMWESYLDVIWKEQVNFSSCSKNETMAGEDVEFEVCMMTLINTEKKCWTTFSFDYCGIYFICIFLCVYVLEHCAKCCFMLSKPAFHNLSPINLEFTCAIKEENDAIKKNTWPIHISHIVSWPISCHY